MATIFLVRHGQTDWNAERRWQGHADPPLNERGRAEARVLADRLAGRGLRRVYSSDLERARETAEIVGAALRLPVKLDERLREVDVGEWSGLTLTEVEERFPDGFRRRREGGTGWAEGEPFDVMAERVLAALRDLAGRHGDEPVIVVTHGGPIRAVATACRGDLDGWVHAGNCDWDVIAVEAGQMRWLDSSRGGLHEQVQG
jgi:broad specificity phosphatase PhoE